MTSNHSETPKPCENGCGFFGNSTTRNLCSVCYKILLEEEAHSSVVLALEACAITPSTKVSQEDCSSTVDNGSNVKVNEGTKTKKNRCQSCRKRVGLLGFGCRCGGTFCGLHRLPEEHACNTNYKAAGRVLLEKENPTCIADKLGSRV